MKGKIITREEVMKRSLILPEVLANIPDRCECGGEVGFSSDLREVVCLNPKCFYKTAERLGDMAEAMGVTGFDKWTCTRICKEFKLESPFMAFLIESKDKGLNEKLNALRESPSRECSLVEMAEYSGIPLIADNAETLFRKVGSIEQFYGSIIGERVRECCRGGVGLSELSVALQESKEELTLGERVFYIRGRHGR
jgi:hypothetical protein